MDKIKKILKDNKYTVIGLLIFIVVALIVSFLYNLLFSGAGNPVYGNRLDGIENVEITKEDKEKIVNTLKDNKIVMEASCDIKGKILNVIIKVNKDTKLNDAKKLTSIITEQISKEQKEFYDIQVFLDIDGEEIDGYPTIGYLGKNAKDFKYTTASYEKDEE